MTASSHSHAPWRKAILVPFLFLQLGFELFMIVLLVLSVNCLSRKVDEDGNIYGADTHALRYAEHIIFPIWLLILCLCLSFTLAEIILFARGKLKPFSFLITTVIKSTVWVVLPILDIASVVGNHESHIESTIAISIEASLLLCFWIHLVYAGVIYHQFRTDARLYALAGHSDSNLTLQNQEYGVPTTENSFTPPYKSYVLDP